MSTSSVHCSLGEPGSIHLIGSQEMLGWLARVTLCQSTWATEGSPKLLKEHGCHDSFGNCGEVVEIRLEVTRASLQKLLVLEEITDTTYHKKRMSPLRPEIYSMTLDTHKIPQEGSSPTSSSRQGQLCNQTMLLRALTSQAMKKLLRMKTEQPVHYFPSPWWRKSFFLYSAWTFLVSVYAHCLSSLHHSALWRA